MALAPYPWLEEPAHTLLAMRDRMPNAVLLYGASLHDRRKRNIRIVGDRLIYELTKGGIL